MNIHADTTIGAVVSAVSLIAVIGFTTIAPRRYPPAVLAVPIAAMVVATGLTSRTEALDELRFMAPTVGFLAAVLVIADMCGRTGVFDWIGSMLSAWSRGSPNRLLQTVFAVAAVTTAILSLDATIVLLTPVAIETARRMRMRVAPVSYATSHLANSASTLLPVSNLTNLLAFSATGLSFIGFAGLMAAPWLITIVVEYLIFRWFFADALSQRHASGPHAEAAHDSPASDTPVPRFTLVCLALLLAGFVIAEPLGVPLAAVAAIGAVVMVVPTLVRRPRDTVVGVVHAVNIPFLAFVLALGVVILPVRSGPLGDAVAQLIPSSTGLFALLAVAVLAALLANLLNNLPATLLLVPLTAAHPPLVLAVLLGVNIGPNLAFFGSLATLLWRDVLRRRSIHSSARDYLRLGALTVPPTLLAATIALWVGLSLT